jgi:hypothetical protein
MQIKLTNCTTVFNILEINIVLHVKVLIVDIFHEMKNSSSMLKVQSSSAVIKT